MPPVTTRPGGNGAAIVRRTRIAAMMFENFESRAFPQGFLNHLETPAPYPDSSGLSGFGLAQKSVFEQRLS